MDEKEKKALFEELYALDDESQDESDEIKRIDALARDIKPADESKQSPVMRNARGDTVLMKHTTHAFSRTMSATLQSSGSSTVAKVQTPSFSHLLRSIRAATVLQREASDLSEQKPSNEMKKVTKPSAKRKRGQPLPVVPEGQQLFKGLSFYFFPDNDIAEPRRLRIAKAIQYGAVWAKEWSDSVTHVIVDGDLNYDQLLRHLNVDSLPSHIVIAHENYPAYCIQERFLLDPRHPLYEVKGYQRALPNKSEHTVSKQSTTSLQVKPVKGAVDSQRTPSRTESSGRDLKSQSANSESSVQQVSESPLPSIDYVHDALSEAIEEARFTKDLPLDSEEDKNAEKASSFDFSDDDREEERRSKSRSKKSLSKSWQEGFGCMSKHDAMGKAENPNARTIEVLQQMADYYDRAKDYWRTAAYRKVIGQLKKCDIKVVTAAQALKLPWVGKRLAAKIEEIVWTDRLRRLDSTKLEPSDEALQTFLKIYGVGLAQATKWVEQGYRTIPELLEKVPLTMNQKVGIDHLVDFQERIARQEMQQHDEYVCSFSRKLDTGLQFTIGGSYRRGAMNSGDIDFIVTKPNASLEVVRTIMLETVIPCLFKHNYLKVGLATTDKNSGSKWHGAAALPGNTAWRRIDFLFVPWDEIGAALIYFTGNDIFNRSIRLLARKRGMRLNQRGLFKDVIGGKNKERLTQGTLVEGKDERKIFEALDVPWRPPEHRIC